MTKPARPLSLAAAWMAVIILAVSCAGESPPSPCIAAAQDAGLPDGVVDQLRDPGDLEAGEWLDLHRVLDEADISDVCGQITAPAEGEQEEEAPEPGGELPDATPVSQEAEHPEAPAPSLEHSARIPEEDEHRRRCRFWALNNLQPIVYQEFAKLDPETMDDLDRILWRSILHPHAHLGFYDNDDARGDAIPSLRPKEPGILCRDYWAEPVGPTNAGLRNHGLEAQCRRRLEERITSRYFQLADAVNYQEDRRPGLRDTQPVRENPAVAGYERGGPPDLRQAALRHPQGTEPLPLRAHAGPRPRRGLPGRLPAGTGW